MTASVDPSFRFVLTEDAPYLRNLAALWTVEPKLAAEIESLEGVEPCHVEPSKAGLLTLSVKTPDGRVVYLHSRYQPLEEAKRLIDPVKVDGCVAFYLQGLGLGYHLELLFDRASDEAIICVLEPDLLILRTAFQHRDFSRLIESRRVIFIWQADKGELFARLTPHSAILSLGFEGVSHPPSLQLAPDFHRQIQTWIAEYASFCRTSFQTLISNSRRTAENVSRNLGWYAATPSIDRLKDRYKGFPAIVVAAGPSLRKNKHLLKDVAGNAVLVAVQTILQPLLEMGIEPHFVTSLDYHDICTRFFENLPENLSTELVAEPKATSKIFSMYPGPLSLTGNEFAEGLTREMSIRKAPLQAGATVAHLAYYLAEYLGCNPIIFVGQDLGFSDGLFYTPGTSYEDVWRPELSRFCSMEMKQWEQIVRNRNILRKIPDHQGVPMYTEERLFSYLQHFERDFSQSKSQIIDASEGGARKRGTTPMTLASAIQQFCTRPLPVAPPDSVNLQWDRIGSCIKSLENRREEAVQIEKISNETLPLLQEVRDALGDHARVNRIIARIDALRTRMHEFGPCYDLILQMTQLTELQRFQRDRCIAAAKVEGVEKQRRQVLRDIENVRGVVGAAKEFQNLMDEVIAQLAAVENSMSRGITR